MNVKDFTPTQIVVAAAIGAALLYWLKKKAEGVTAAGVGQAVAGAAVDAATGVVSGTVKAIGGAVGVPETSKTQCQRDIENGDTWGASFSCPAGDFMRYVATGKGPQDATAAEAKKYEAAGAASSSGAGSVPDWLNDWQAQLSNTGPSAGSFDSIRGGGITDWTYP